MNTGEGTDCRSYRFGHVVVDVLPELVVIAEPYGASHDDFCDASVFVERYTHAAAGTLIEDDDLELSLHLYPNTENLIGGPPYAVPLEDPRLGLWDEPSRRPDSERTTCAEPPPLLIRLRLYGALAHTEQYVQEIGIRHLVRTTTQALHATGIL